MDIESKMTPFGVSHTFHVNYDGHSIRVTMSSPKKGTFSMVVPDELKEEGFDASGDHWYGDEDYLPGEVHFTIKAPIEEPDEDGWIETEWDTYEVEPVYGTGRFYDDEVGDKVAGETELLSVCDKVADALRSATQKIYALGLDNVEVEA